MNDMTSVIAPKSDQLNSDDLIAGPRTIAIRDVAIRPGTEQPVSIFFENDNNKPWKPCKSMSRVLVSVWGPDAKLYIGRSVTLYRDAEVTWGGMKVGGIRVSHVSHIDKPVALALTATKGKKAIATIRPLSEQKPAPQQQRQGPAEWVAEMLPKIKAADLDRLAVIKDKTANTVESLREKFPPQYQRIVDAFAEREQELSDPREGRSEEQHGDQFDGADRRDVFAADDDGFGDS